MAGRIKGITIEIGGNTQPLQNALKDVNKQSDALAKELKDVERLILVILRHFLKSNSYLHNKLKIQHKS